MQTLRVLILVPAVEAFRYLTFLLLIKSPLPKASRARIWSLAAMMVGSPTRFGFDHDSRLWFAFEPSSSQLTSPHYFADSSRGLGMYFRGLAQRGRWIYESYCLNHPGFDATLRQTEKPLVIEVGPNGSDLSLGLTLQNPNCQVIAFEPAPQSCRATQLNLKVDGACHQVALGDHEQRVTFFVSEKDGDSSIFKPAGGYENEISVEMKTLDSFEIGFEREILLLKLEAEGNEPQIIKGGVDTFSRTRFVALDGGPEAGRVPEQTFEDSLTLLTNLGFQLVKIDFKTGAGRALFQNLAL